MIYLSVALIFAASLGYAWLVRDTWRNDDRVLAAIFAIILCATLVGVVLASADATRLYFEACP